MGTVRSPANLAPSGCPQVATARNASIWLLNPSLRIQCRRDREQQTPGLFCGTPSRAIWPGPPGKANLQPSETKQRVLVSESAPANLPASREPAESCRMSSRTGKTKRLLFRAVCLPKQATARLHLRRVRGATCRGPTKPLDAESLFPWPPDYLSHADSQLKTPFHACVRSRLSVPNQCGTKSPERFLSLSIPLEPPQGTRK